MNVPPEPSPSTLPTEHGVAPQPLDLVQRMALRRNLADRAVQIGLALVGVTRSSYRARAVPIDARHHRYLVALDVSPDFAPAQEGRALTRSALEAWLQEVARQRYRVIFDAIYWRGVSEALSLGDDVRTMTSSRSDAGDVLAPLDVHVSEEERMALLDAVQRGMALPPLVVDDDIYRTGPAPLEPGPRKSGGL